MLSQSKVEYFERINELREETYQNTLENYGKVFDEKAKKRKFVYLTPYVKPVNLQHRIFYTFDSETRDGLCGKELYCWSLAYPIRVKDKFGKFSNTELETINSDNMGGYYGNNNTDNCFDYRSWLPKIFKRIGIKSKKKDWSKLFGLDKLFDFFKESKDKNKGHLRIIWVHNLGFDIRFIVEYCARNSINCKQPIISGSNVMALTIPEYNIRFVDSFQFLFASQEKAENEWLLDEKFEEYKKEQTIDTKKIFEKNFSEWSKIEKSIVKVHCKNDVKALWFVMNEMRKTMFEISNVDMIQTQTLASLSMKAFRITMFEELERGNLKDEKGILNPMVYSEWDIDKNNQYRPLYNHDAELDKFIRSSYFGGRCEVFENRLVKKASYLDKVSQYPDVMKNRPYPIGLGYYELNKENLINMIREKGKVKQYEGFINLEWLGFSKKCRDYSKYPIFAEKRDKKTTFSYCSKQNVVYTLPELRQYYQLLKNELGYNDSIIFSKYIRPDYGFCYCERDFIFSKFVDKFFKVKSENKGGRRNSAKIILNSAYGKWGQAFERKGNGMHYFIDEADCEEFIYDSENAHEFNITSENGLYIVIEPTLSIIRKPFMNVGIASYVTVYARLELWKQLHLMELQNIPVLYSDTDSFTIEDKYLEIVKAQPNFGKQLGNWDIEQAFDEVKFVALKCYFKRESGKVKIKLKGVDRDKIEEIQNKAEKENLSIDEVYELCKEPIQLAERYMKYTEAHRSGYILNTKERSKHYSFENLKREFLPNGCSNPWNNESILKFPNLCKVG